MIITMKLCPLVEEDKKSPAIKGHCIPQAWNFFSQRKKINSRLTCHQVFSESNLHSSCCVRALPKSREDAVTTQYSSAAAGEDFARGDPAELPPYFSSAITWLKDASQLGHIKPPLGLGSK